MADDHDTLYAKTLTRALSQENSIAHSPVGATSVGEGWARAAGLGIDNAPTVHTGRLVSQLLVSLEQDWQPDALV